MKKLYELYEKILSYFVVSVHILHNVLCDIAFELVSN